MASMIKYYTEFIGLKNRAEVAKNRRDLFSVLNGEAFFKLTSWPQWVQRSFWKKPIKDSESFKLALFFIGNGCEPTLINKWIMTCKEWEPINSEKEKKALKRARQLHFIERNLDTKRGEWFYFDLQHKKVLYLDGTQRQQ